MQRSDFWIKIWFLYLLDTRILQLGGKPVSENPTPAKDPLEFHPDGRHTHGYLFLPPGTFSPMSLHGLLDTIWSQNSTSQHCTLC